jgi:hypothetical protein
MDHRPRPRKPDRPDDGVREELTYTRAMGAQGYRSAGPGSSDGEMGGLNLTPDNLRRSGAQARDAERLPAQRDRIGRDEPARRPPGRPAPASGLQTTDEETATLLRLQAELLAQSQEADRTAGSALPVPQGAARTPDPPATAPDAEAPRAAPGSHDPRLRLHSGTGKAAAAPVPFRRPRRPERGTPEPPTPGARAAATPQHAAYAVQPAAPCQACGGSGICAVCAGSGHEPGKLYCHGCQGCRSCLVCGGDRVLR